MYPFLPCRWLKQEKESAEASKSFDSGPKLDLGFKEGQTIKLNLSVRTFTEMSQIYIIN
jgi:hypothetical protein